MPLASPKFDFFNSICLHRVEAGLYSRVCHAPWHTVEVGTCRDPGTREGRVLEYSEHPAAGKDGSIPPGIIKKPSTPGCVVSGRPAGVGISPAVQPLF